VPSVFDRDALGTPIESDGPVPQDVSADQTSVVSLLRENGGKYTNGIYRLQIGAREPNGTRMLPAAVRSADRRYLAFLTRLKEFAIIGKFLAYDRYGCTGIEKRLYWTGLRIF
jgi:hypothetical protein